MGIHSVILALMKTMKALLEAMRLKAWTKNLFVFAALLFGRAWSADAGLATILAALGFGLISSSIYLLNDSVDMKNDRLHPEKCKRPIASGRLSGTTAVSTAILLAVLTMTASWILAPTLALVFTAYLVKQVSYSLKLKGIVILDCILIALGFVFRALAGVAVLYDMGISIKLSPWLVICTFFLALLLGFAKRRHELDSLGTGAVEHRKNLKEYTISLLDQMISITAGASILGYSIYTVSDRTSHEVSPHLWITIPFVVYGVFRYLFLVYSAGQGGSPDRILIKDGPLKLDLILWVVTVGIILFRDSSLL
ncbi:decaprenyl-phosphate phosphoribosyltransferase [Candidatus Fermentibacteria bacterium]|nr:MAG: decaprenyl-phosphate phosphoribosyltransferase [Candidatus Fermentibacteria bacterium]